MHNYLIFLSLIAASQLNVAQAAEAAQCYEHGNYVVMETPLANDNVGNDFSIYQKTTADEKVDCPLKKTTWSIPNEEAESYLGQQGDLLILDSGTGTSGRNLFIWDLAQRKQIKRFSYADEVRIEENQLIYSVPSDEKVTPKICPKLEELTKSGMTVSVGYEEQLDLKTLEVSRSREAKCLVSE